jgi:hypothetical protein
MAKLCGGSGTPDQKTKFAALMEIWNGRINLGVEENDIIKTPFESFQMILLLQRITSIFQSICPAVNPKYLSILKNAFLWHLRGTWNENKLEETMPPEIYFKHAGLFVDSCQAHLGPIIPINPLVKKIFN